MSKPNLLYVDDEESNLRIFKDTFRRKFNIFTAISAKEGLKILETKKIDLVLSDQRMPEMTGVDFFKQLVRKYPSLNRILITGFSDIDTIEDAINNASIFQYIKKPWDENTLLKVIENALDIHKLKKDNESQHKELIIAKEKAEKSDRLKTEFLNNMSHEIRTPMNGILGFSQLLNNSDLTDKKRKHFINIIQNSGNQLLKIIDDILEISNLGTGQLKASNSPVCLNDLLLELFSVFDINAKENKTPLYLKKGLLDKESTIFIDRIKLKKILSKLLENALKFTNVGHIEFGYTVKNKTLHLYVKDTGCGITLEQQKFIFENFSRKDENSNQIGSGLGLGLSIAKENTKLLEGTITVSSEKNKGATFSVNLPYNPVYTKPKKNETAKDDCVILIAEDEEVNFLYLETLLNLNFDFPYKILHAKDGIEAVEICKQNENINFILMDIKMPNMNGLEATKLIKIFRPNLPIIVQTAYSSVEDKLKAKEVGCDDFISKPISLGVFKLILNKFKS